MFKNLFVHNCRPGSEHFDVHLWRIRSNHFSWKNGSNQFNLVGYRLKRCLSPARFSIFFECSMMKVLFPICTYHAHMKKIRTTCLYQQWVYVLLWNSKIYLVSPNKYEHMQQYIQSRWTPQCKISFSPIRLNAIMYYLFLWTWKLTPITPYLMLSRLCIIIYELDNQFEVRRSTSQITAVISHSIHSLN